MKTNLTISRTLQTLAFIGLLSVSAGAYALCMNADGTLDDLSVSPGTINVEMLPACESPAPNSANVEPVVSVTQQNKMGSDKTEAKAKSSQKDGGA